MNIDSKLLTIIDNLQDAVDVSNESKLDPDKGYPYATGYSRSAMESVILDLNQIVEQYRNITCETIDEN
jgi:hypothetical protein